MRYLFEMEKEGINEQKSTGWFDSLPMVFLNLRKIIDTTGNFTYMEKVQIGRLMIDLFNGSLV